MLPGAACLRLALAGAAMAQAPDPDAAAPPGSTFTILDLQFRIEPIAGGIQALEVKETPTEIRIELAADIRRPDAAPTLGQAADIVRRQGKRGVSIEGHTDGKGAADYNQRLSERRAVAVQRWLAGEGGLKGVAMKTRGWGAAKPVAPNTKPGGSDDPAGRQKNRRVEIVIAK